MYKLLFGGICLVGAALAHAADPGCELRSVARGGQVYLVALLADGTPCDATITRLPIINLAQVEPPPTAPVVIFEDPPGDITVPAGTSLYVRVGATDPEGITSVRLDKDGAVGRLETAAPYDWNGARNDPELADLPAGAFSLMALATDSAGNIGSASIRVTVGAPSDLTYAWDFGDGSTGSGVAPEHIYAAPGTYEVTLTVTDSAGLSDRSTSTVTISEAPPPPAIPPTADAGGPYFGTVGEPVLFNGAGSSNT